MSSIFTPFLCQVVGISNARQCVVSFSSDHNFTLGEYVSLRVSKPYAMVEANNLRGLVIDLTPTTITLDLDTQYFTPFVYPPSGTVAVLSVAVPAGSGIIPDSNPPTVNLVDAFDNQPV